MWGGNGAFMTDSSPVLCRQSVGGQARYVFAFFALKLAQRVGLSAAPCWRRVKSLEESGFITGYRAEINRQKIGLGVLAFVRLDADRNSGDVLHTLEEAIRTIPEVVSCPWPICVAGRRAKAE